MMADITDEDELVHGRRREGIFFGAVSLAAKASVGLGAQVAGAVGDLAGLVPGAAVATVAIFLPAFVFVAGSGPFVPALRKSRLASRLLDCVNVASLALMAGVLVWLSSTALVDPLTMLVSAASLVALVRYEVHPVSLLAAGALLGWVAVMTGN